MRFFRLFLLTSVSAGFATQIGAARASEDAHERLSRLEGLSGVSGEPAPEPVHAADATPSHGSKPKAHKQKSAEHAAAAGGHHAAPAAGGHHGAAAPSSDLSALRSIEDRLMRLEEAAAKSAHEGPKTAAAHTGGEHAKGAGGHADSDVKVEFNYLRPSFASADGKNTLSIRALVQADAASYDQDRGDQGAGVLADHGDLGSGAVIRRARFGIEGKFQGDFVYEMRLEFGDADAEPSGKIDIMRVGYTGIPNTRVHLGVIQPIMTMADPTSSSELIFLERPAVVGVAASAFGGKSGRRGVEATFQKTDALYGGDNLLISGALTGGTVGSTHSGFSDDEGVNLLGRVAYRLYSDESTNIQVGATGAEVLNAPQPSTTVATRYIKFRDRPEAGVSTEYLVEACTSGTTCSGIASDGVYMYGFETGMNFDNFFLGAERYEFNVDRSANVNDPSFSGWYVEGTWILTGETRRYVASGTGNSIAV